MNKKRKPSHALSDQSLKEVLIEVSDDIIEKKGLDALTLRGAARAAGVSHMAPYRHFQDKDALLAAVAGRGFLGLAKAMQKEAVAQVDPTERLLGIGVVYVEYALAHPGLFRLMFSSGIGRRSSFPELAAAGEAAFLVCVNTVADCHNGDDKLPPQTLQDAALVLWSLVHGLANLLIDQHVDLATHGPGSSRETLRAILQASEIQHKPNQQP